MTLSSTPLARPALRGFLRQVPVWVSTWRIIPRIDKDPQIIAYVQCPTGRIVLFMAMTALACSCGFLGVDLTVAPLAVACGYAQRLRRYLVPLATLLLLLKQGFWVDGRLIRHVAEQEGLAGRINQPLLLTALLALFAILCCSLLAFWPRLCGLAPFRRSTRWVILTWLALVAAAQLPIVSGLPRVIIWAFVATCQPYLWFLCYALLQSGKTDRAPIWQQLGLFHPFWGSTLTPFGKGLTYLRKYEATSPEEAAVTQLKGVKLALWTLLLALVARYCSVIAHDVLSIPYFDDVFLQHVAGQAPSRITCWESLFVFFVEDMLSISVWGGAIISCVRLAGFRLLRNTYRPMEATTLAEFWNRYYFYYKELLVDHFFFPTFLHYFRGYRRIRMFFATFCAACFGNLLFHFIRDIHFVAEMGFRNAIYGEASHAFYTFLLAVGVGLSQTRTRKRDLNRGWLRTRLIPCAYVILFFCILHVFDAPLDRIHSIWQRAEFLFYLAGAES